MALINEGMENDILKAAEAAIEAAMNPRTRRDYTRLVIAGMKVAMRGGPQGLMRNLPSSKDPVRDCAIGAVNLAFMMAKTAQSETGNVPENALTYACYGLMLQALDVAAKLGLVEITNELVAEATKIATDRIFANMRITPEMLNTAAGKVNDIIKDPAMMEKLKLEIGASRDPRAPTPTLPEMAPGLINAKEAPDAV